MNELIAAHQADPDYLDNLHVTLLGDPNNAVSGILDRFQFPDGVSQFSFDPEPQHIPFLGIPMDLATTPTTGIATDIYMGEYDGFADFPEDPSNLFADLNERMEDDSDLDVLSHYSLIEIVGFICAKMEIPFDAALFKGDDEALRKEWLDGEPEPPPKPPQHPAWVPKTSTG